MPLPAAPGIGFKPEHFSALRENRNAIGFLEVHAENYMGDGGPPHRMLEALRADFPISFHGVGLSIGGASINKDHLARLKRLLDRYQPDSFSEHLAWSSHGFFFNDLLPLAYTSEALALVCDHIDEVQAALGRQILLENPATYVMFEQSTIPEVEFLKEISRVTGCGLLLDVNTVFVSCSNHQMNPREYLSDFPMKNVGEIHLGGHDAEVLPEGILLIDAHGCAVADPVWTLFEEVIARIGPMPSLIEWDNDVPEYHILSAEATRAAAILNRRVAHAAR